jgi:hypothetical protein
MGEQRNITAVIRPRTGNDARGAGKPIDVGQEFEHAPGGVVGDAAARLST